MSEDEVSQMVSEIDQNGDGQIDYQEFVKFWRDSVIASKLSPLERMLKVISSRLLKPSRLHLQIMIIVGHYSLTLMGMLWQGVRRLSTGLTAIRAMRKGSSLFNASKAIGATKPAASAATSASIHDGSTQDDIANR
jgi:hypothetical protein